MWAWASRTFRFNPETKKLDTLETDVRPEYPLMGGEVDWYDPPDPGKTAPPAKSSSAR